MRRIAIVIAATIAVLAAGAAAFFWWQSQAGGNPAFFESEIAAFEAADRENPPAPGGIVFVGSSSIRLWDTLAEDFAPLPTVRRGFGGAHMEHVVFNARRIVTPYAPRAVVVFCGGNDIGAGKDAARVLADYRAFVAIVHAELPDADIWFLSMKPSNFRFEIWEEQQIANAGLQELAASDSRLHYINVSDALLGSDGTPRDDVFIFDGLHLNATGYAAWTAVIRPILMDAYGPDAAAPRG